MEITGADYTYLTDADPKSVETIFLAQVSKFWPSPIVETYDRTEDHIELFLARDSALNRFHEEHGFSLDENGEGCFMFCARKFVAFESDAKISNAVGPRELVNSDPYDTRLLFENSWEYTLVLPSLLEESEFSRRIHDHLVLSIKSAGKSLAEQKL